MRAGRPSAGTGAARFLWLAVALVGLVVAPFLLFGAQLEEAIVRGDALSLLAGYGGYAWVVAFGLLLADLILPVPASAVMAALGMIYGPVLGGALSAAGSVVSGLAGYVLCRVFGRMAARWLAGEAGLRKGEAIFNGEAGGWLVLASRWLPILAEVVSCLAGLSRMRFQVYFTALLCGSVPLGFAYAAIGYAGSDRPVATLVLSAFLPLVLWLLVRPWLKIRG